MNDDKVREVNLINRSKGVHFVLKCIAPFLGLMPKTLYKFRYWVKSGKKLNIKNPTELQGWIIADYYKTIRNRQMLDELARLTDKLAVRDFAKERIGEKYLTGLIGSWEKVSDVDFSILPPDCVVKTNNGCGTNMILRADKPRDEKALRATLKDWMSYPYGKLSAMPHYTAIKPMILAEEYLIQNPETDELPYDYKFFCFNGRPEFVLFYSGRRPNSHKTFNMVYDRRWQPVADSVRRPGRDEMPRPEVYDEMLEVAAKLSAGFRFVRVDLYAIGKRIVFGEMTFTPDVYINFTDRFLADSLKYVK